MNLIDVNEVNGSYCVLLRLVMLFILASDSQLRIVFFHRLLVVFFVFLFFEKLATQIVFKWSWTFFRAVTL